MSLILDALRKAEAERQRGAVPGLQNVAAPPPLRPPRRRLGAAAGAALVLGLLLVGAFVVWRIWPVPPAPAPAVPPVEVALPTTAATATMPAPAPLPRVVSAPPAAAAGPGGAEPAPPPAPPTRPQVAPVAPATPVAAAPILTQVRRLADLPPDQRRELPPLAVGGSVWSEQPSARFVVLDGQVLREGDAAAPGLVLVKLAPRSATLRWRDTLIEVPF